MCKDSWSDNSKYERCNLKRAKSQAEVAQKFSEGIDGYATFGYDSRGNSSFPFGGTHEKRDQSEAPSHNFRSEDGILWHYSTIEAIRTNEGKIIENSECWSKGWASCTSVPGSIGSFPLSSFQEYFDIEPKTIINFLGDQVHYHPRQDQFESNGQIYRYRSFNALGC